jgi:CO/xanthine dehydrogenase FAD-binding subunit
MVKVEDRFYISGASLNPFVSRFKNLEELFNKGDFSDDGILKALDKDTNPSSSFRSTKEYRIRVLVNMLREALKGFESE